MDKHDIERLKNSVNIVDIIGSVVNLKRSGHNHFGLCPFHNEKTPSFSVDEKDQFYHCFGCPAQGDVIKFVQDYAGVEFIDAVRELGGEVDVMPSEKVKANQQRAVNQTSYSVPIDHKQDTEKSRQFMSDCKMIGPNYYHNETEVIPVFNHNGELVNIFNPLTYGFLAGGISYGGFYVLPGETKTIQSVCVTNINDAKSIKNKWPDLMVYVCFTDSNMLYVCDYAKPKNLDITPIITSMDDNAIAYEMDYLVWDGHQLYNGKRL